MKRFAIGMLLAAGMAAVFVFVGITRTSEYRRLVEAGDTALDQDDTFLAIEAFSGAIALRGDSMLAHLKRGQTYQRRGDLEAARRDLTRANALDPAATRLLEVLGDVSFGLGRHEDAAVHYAAYVALDDQTSRVLYKLALAHHSVGRAALAIPLLRQVIELAPEMPEAPYLLGLALRDQDRQDEAIDALRQAVALSPGFTTAREALGALLGVAGHPNDRIEQLEALAALDPNTSQRDVDLGLAYAGVNRTDMAVLSLGRASEEHPEEAHVYAALGRVWLDIARTTDDRTALTKSIGALQSIPQATASSEALTLLARALLLAGELEEAVVLLELATVRYPLDPSAFAELADLVEQAGDLPRARQLLVVHDTLTAHVPGARRLARVR
jgi:tetratricopeptide (TPR) repeat protein